MIDEDRKTTERLRLVHPALAKAIRAVMEEMFVTYKRKTRVTDGLRTMEFQANLYAQGRTSPGPIVTKSPPGESLHNYGLAVDVCFVGMDPFLERDPQGEKLWKEFGRMVKNQGLKWGGDFSAIDRPHAEMITGLTLAQLKKKAESGLDGVWSILS